MNGEYIVIEGNDGTGKSTQIRELAKYLRRNGQEVVIVEEPGSDDADKSTPVANYLRAVIKNDTIARGAEINLALFSAARRELWLQKIQPALDRGAYVLAVRNYLSTIAYQAGGEGLDAEHIVDITQLFTGERYLSPDKTLILLLGDETERQKRIAERGQPENPDTFESRGASFQQSVNASYEQLARAHNLPTIDCVDNGHARSIDEIQQELRTILEL